jgi:GT2 family glycosyltransferase
VSLMRLPPAMPSTSPADWSGSLWIGALDVSMPVEGGILLDDADGCKRARLLIRDGRVPLGFVELDIHEGHMSPSGLLEAMAVLPRAAVPSETTSLNPISVIVCTRDRPEALRSALSSLLAVDYPDFEIIVVDNASITDASHGVVTSLNDPRLRLVTERAAGLARARNRGVLMAAHEVVAFTDDDVVVDPGWLRGLMDGFSLGTDIACVCGMVPSGELRSFSQAYFDARVTWARRCQPEVYRLSDPPKDQVLFPFQVGQYGTGANFAMARSTLIELGGFDEALGVGSPTRGGEDIDMFVRVLLAGHGLAYQPSALVWHRHRADLAALQEQIVGYGLGLGAWIAKLLTDRRTAPMVLRRAIRGLLHARQMTRVSLAPVVGSGHSAARRLATTELSAMARGPMAYLGARRAGANKAPLLDSRPAEGRAA